MGEAVDEAVDEAQTRAWFSPSLNRVVLADLTMTGPDGVRIFPAHLAGTRADRWLMAAAVDHDPRALDRRVARGEPGALRRADEVGTALACLLATLTLAPPDARFNRPDWPDRHWRQWASVRTVALGGGLVSGALGARLAATARARLEAAGITGVRVVVADDPTHLTLRGAGCGLPDGPVALIDAGHTQVKRAVAEVHDGRAIRLQVAEPVASQEITDPHALLDRLAELSLPLLRAGADQLGCSLAVYCDETGQPRADQLGWYAPLHRIPVRATLERVLSSRSGRPIRVAVGHDGSCAARDVHGRADAAITLGTSIGHGLNV